MRPLFLRLGLIATAVAVVISCDSALPSAPKVSSKGTPQKDLVPPTVTIDSPTTHALVNVGDSLLVKVQLHDNVGLKALTLVGLKVRGSVALGTFTQTPRYTLITVPISGTFRTGLTDTTIRRYLQPVTPVDTTTDSLVVQAVVTDSAGNVDSASVTVNMVVGPKVTVLTPVQGDSVPPGAAMPLSVEATSAAGVGRITVRVQGDTNWPTKMDTTITQSYSNGPHDITLVASIVIPGNAPPKSHITISASALDANQTPGAAAPVVITVRTPNNQPPLVTQVVPTKIEFIDSIAVTATATVGIASIGYVATDTLGNLVKRDSVLLPQPYASRVSQNVPVNLTIAQQGMRLVFTAFAVDQAGHTGYSVSANSTFPQASLATAKTDTILITYGRTYRLPATRNGIIADIAVDPKRGNAYLSNTSFNLLEAWVNSSKTFNASGVAVGSQPWGLAPSPNGDTLFVANSGATTISRVAIAGGIPVADLLGQRIRTRASYLFVITVATDPTTGKETITAQGPIEYSDRPEYVAQSKGGRIFYSTLPTTAATPGTIRWLDPTLAVPDPQQVWQYGNILPQSSGSITYVLFNADSIGIAQALPNTSASDVLFLFDHPYGASSGSIVVADSLPVRAVLKADSLGSDMNLVAGLDYTSLALTDTTFVGISGDHSWVGFGEGATKGGPGLIAMVNDPSGPLPGFFSPKVSIADLVNNASDNIFGLAVDSTGLLVGAHGVQANFASLDIPFHLRLTGTYQSLPNSAGITFHPAVNGLLTGCVDPATGAKTNRTAFVASGTGAIEIVDVAYFVNRGTLQLKYGVYGPLRVSRPFPGDPPSVVLKLFAMDANGLLVIDLSAADIAPGPGC